MLKSELIAMLNAIEGDFPVMIHDRVSPREINISPSLSYITMNDEDECADCEGLAGTSYIKIGFGSY